VSRELAIAVVDYESFRIALIESLHLVLYRARGFPSTEEFVAGVAKDRCLAILG
jgi:hypothetical protein